MGCPRSVADSVAQDAATTKDARAAAVEAVDARKLAKARVTLQSVFPRIPSPDATKVLQTAFRKYSGRVGRATTLDDDEKVFLAVQAHVRHTMTPYDKLLDGPNSLTREEARKAVEAQVRSVLASWCRVQDDTRAGGLKVKLALRSKDRESS